MATVIEMTGKTVDEAIQAAVEQLRVPLEDLEIEILETPTKRLFGLFGETPAKIRAKVKEPPIVEEQIHIEPEPEPPAIEPILEPSPVEEKELSNREQLICSAKKFLQDVFATMNLQIAIEVEEVENDVKLNLIGKDASILIGRRGQALDALQYIANLAVNRKREENKLHFTLDVEDYRRRREVTLKKLAKSVAERAIKTRKEVKLEPMNRHERKIIHTVLQENNRVETHSAGEEPYRYVIVTPVKRGKR